MEKKMNDIKNLILNKIRKTLVKLENQNVGKISCELGGAIVYEIEGQDYIIEVIKNDRA